MSERFLIAVAAIAALLLFVAYDGVTWWMIGPVMMWVGTVGGALVDQK